MKTILLSLVLALSFSQLSYAEQSTKNSDIRNSIEKMFELTNMQSMLDNSYAQMDQVFSQMTQEKNIDEDKKPIIEKHRKKFKKLLIESMSWNNIKEPIIEAYSHVYTKEEIDELNVFYQSPLGQKMIKKMPELMQVTFQVMQEFSQALIPKMQVLQKELQAELKG